MIAALYVQKNGAYFGLPDVDPWDQERDARRYAGPHRVVAHPPCGRWCAMARLNERRWGARVGDDGGCFAAALGSVRRFGGVLEHPAFSLAWPAFSLSRPVKGRWTRDAGRSDAWVAQVSQGAYGHKARKKTWLLYVGESTPPDLDWSEPAPSGQVGGGVNTGNNALPRLSAHDAIATPPAFRDLLIRLARLG